MENITSQQLEELISNKETILVDYWAKWCGPCKTLIPRLESFEAQYPNVKFVKVDVDENQDHAVEAGIRGIPTIIIMQNGEIVDRSSGVNPESYYKNILNDL